MSATDTYSIRPAGRLVLTIGRELIQDAYAAVVELVKNAYDADSHDVDIRFRKTPQQRGYSITITDHGHGMSRDDVINKWLVPSTDDKLQRGTSPSGRLMQGRKGIGRYAASVLGTDLFLHTVTPDGHKTEVYLQWKDFENAQYLDDVEILVATSATTDPPGTFLTITGDDMLLTDWTQREFDKLRFELRRLKSPVPMDLNTDDFRIYLEVSGFPKVRSISEEIQPYPIFNLFDYRISGCVTSQGSGELQYSMQKIRNAPVETISFDYNGPTVCGDLFFDIRVYDRDTSSIDSLIARGLKNDSGGYLGNLQARRVLNDYNGIGVYRNGFRIRPLGDPDFDWLKLNEQRIQNPSLRIGSNQVIGLVQIQSEERSGLIEKSARDGLRENQAYHHLKAITTRVIAALESRRFKYRRDVGLTKTAATIERSIERLRSSESLKRDIRVSLSKSGVAQQDSDAIIAIVDRDEEERHRVADDIGRRVATYQGQATLGKIINVILHEGRRPLNYFRNQVPNLRYWHEHFLRTGSSERLRTIVSIADGIGNNADMFVSLFSRLDPLASRRRSRRSLVQVKSALSATLAVFEMEMQKHSVDSYISCPDDYRFLAWPQDIHMIFTNLIENSLYWMEEKKSSDPKITMNVVTDGETLLHIDYRDTGPGIEPELIASEVIFEPEFSTKPSGTGLGLPIAGEAAARNGLQLKAFECESGAWFRLQALGENGHEQV